MTVKIEMDMPEICSDCPMFEKSPSTENVLYFMGEPLNGKCKFLKKDGSYILADDKGMDNSALPWAGIDGKLNIFQKENDIISDWNWEKIN